MSEVNEADKKRAAIEAEYLACDCDYSMEHEDKRLCEIRFAKAFAAHRLAARREAFEEVVTMVREVIPKYRLDCKEAESQGFSGAFDEGAADALEQLAEAITQLKGSST